MATTQVEFTGDGNATKAFSFPSIQQSDIKVTVDGVLKTSGNHYNLTSYTTTGGGNVVFTSGNIPTSPALIRIFRDTNLEAAAATYTAGASVKAEDLNANQKQLLFHAQEEQDQLEQTGNIRDDAIVTAKILDDSVTMAKLGSGALPTDITVASANLVDGTIVNADVNGSAAIDGTKIDPDFGSQAISTTGNITVGGTVDGRDIAADGTKLDTIETNAKDDQTAAEIRTLVGSATDSNVFTDAEKSKLSGISAGATVNQTASDIRTLVESATDSNVFTDADHTKLNGIQALATDDQTAAEIKTLLQASKLTAAEIADGALDGRYYTETESEARFLRQDSTETIASGSPWSNSDAFVATTAAINARIIDLIDEVGGFDAIANETSFPTSNPQGATGQSAILSIAATSATLTPSGTTVTIANGAGSGNTVTITGVPAVIPQGFGFLVESTSTTHTYSFHRTVPKASDVSAVATNITNVVSAGANSADINSFAKIYQISSSQPSARNDGSSLQVGDLWFNSSNSDLRVWNGSVFSTITPSQSVLNDVAIVSGAITFQEDLGLITDSVTTGSSNGSLDIVADALEDEITFAVTVINSGGNKYVLDGDTSNPAKALSLHKGWTYTFDQSDSSNANHPLRFKTDSGSYTTNVVATGTAGQAGAKVQITIPESQPTGFRYYCTVHGNGMGNTITVIEDPIKVVADDVVKIKAVADNATNINAVNSNASNINSAVANASNINSAVSNATNINSVVSNATNINTVAGSISNVNSVGSNISNVNSVHGNANNINSAVSNATNINTVAGAITNVNTVGSNISNVNNFANRYRIASSAPTSSLDQGDLYFDTTSNELRVYNGSAWQGGVTATGNLPSNGANTFTGDQTIQANIIVTGTVDGRDVAADGTKLDGIETGATADQTASEIAGLISGQTIAPNVITTTNLTLDFGTI